MRRERMKGNEMRKRKERRGGEKKLNKKGKQ